MKSFKQPEWYVKFFKPEEVTDEQLERWEKETKEYRTHKQMEYGKLKKDVGALCAQIKQVFGEVGARKILRAVDNEMQGRYVLPLDITGYKRRVMEARGMIAKIKQEKDRQKCLLKQTVRAALWLKEKGLESGKDFEEGSEIQKANEIAYKEEVKRLEALGGMHDFDVQNCDGPCAGWDGKSHRCECGNRRVYWEAGDFHSFENPFVRAVAY